MTFKSLLAGLTAATMALSASAFAQTLPETTDGFSPYGEVEGWRVFSNAETGHCLVERNDGTNAVQMGLSADNQFGYMGVFTTNPIEAADGMVDEIAIEIGDRRFSGEFAVRSGSLTQGFNGGYVRTQDEEFINAVADEYTMTVFIEDLDPFEIDLTGTMAAMEAGRECLAAMAN
jgi:hypothetical protein